MPAEGDNVDEVKEQLRRDLLPCFEAATLTNAVFFVLTSVGNKGLKRDEVARKIGQHLSHLPGIVRPAQFLERLINNRPLELSQVIEQSRRDEILWVVRSLKPGWQKAKRPRRIKSENDRVKRKRDSKRRHERKRSAEWLDKVGLIDHEFGEARFSALNPYAEPSGACLDAIFQGGTVRRSIGFDSLTRLFGVSRKLLPPRLPRAPHCRSVRYDLRAVLLCMTSLLGTRRCRWLCDLKRRKAILKRIVARAHDVASPDIAAQVATALNPFLK